ncbi:hypothetical protein GGR53DRAFT_478280 [Hypoxylon sp. FL1150]|nr:hypothetical protein GGR53DRAFT_478280 [Hypoxylon sp. FL1150]
MLRIMSDVALATIICTFILTPLAILSLSIHLFTCKQMFAYDNLLILIAFLISLALVGQITWAVVDEGQGQHMSSVTHDQFEHAAKSLLVSEALWALANTLIRLTALLFLLKLFSPVYRLRCLLILLIGVSIAYGIAALLTTALICRPIQASWDNQDQGTCGDQIASFVSLEVVGLIIDLAILIVPIPTILTLNMPLKRRALTILLISAGTVVIVITGLRIAALHRINTSDFSYDQGYLGLLSILGTLISIITCYVPSMYAFIKRL